MLNLSPSGDLREAAANLFSYLQALDRSGAGTIAVEPIPHTGLGEAINDRLSRAAAPRDDPSGQIHDLPSIPPCSTASRRSSASAHALRAEADIAPYVHERRGLFPGRSPLVLRPGSVEEVSRILKLATETRTPVVPQGGNTGLVGGQVPHRLGNEIVLSLSRLNRIREIDPLSNTVTAEAGVVLEALHDARSTPPTGCSRCRWRRRARARSAAICRPMPAAPACSPMAMRASSASASRSCCRPARCSTICAS